METWMNRIKTIAGLTFFDSSRHPDKELMQRVTGAGTRGHRGSRLWLSLEVESARVRDVIGVISDPGPGNGVNGS